MSAPTMKNKSNDRRLTQLSDRMLFLLEWRPANDYCIVHVRCDIDRSTNAALASMIEKAASLKVSVIIVSFPDISCADCSCVTALIKAWKKFRTSLRIVAQPKSALRRILDITELSAVLSVCDSLAEACPDLSLR